MKPIHFVVFLTVAVLVSALAAPAMAGSSCKPQPGVQVRWDTPPSLVPGTTAGLTAVITSQVPGSRVELRVEHPDGSLGDILFEGVLELGTPARIPVAVAVPVDGSGSVAARVRVLGAAGGAYHVGARLPMKPLDLPVRVTPRNVVTASGAGLAFDGVRVGPARPIVPPVQGTAAETVANRVFGTFVYRNRELDAGGYVNESHLEDPTSPIRGAVVELVKSGETVAEVATDENGSYEFTAPGSGTYQVRVLSKAPDAAPPRVQVQASSLSSSIYVGTTASQELVADQDLDMGTVLIEAGSGAAAFNILDGCLSGAELFNAWNGSYPQALCKVFWTPDSQNGSYFNRPGNSIFLLGEEDFDDAVIVHEYGHYVASDILDQNLPGGVHYVDDSNQNPMLSFSEGWASFWQSATWLREGSDIPSWYVDTRVAGGQQFLNFSYDCEEPSFAVKGTASEVVVQAALWDIIDGPDTPDPLPPGDDDSLERPGTDIWAVMTGPVPQASTLTLEDFWEGWFSLAKGFRPEMEAAFGALGAEYYEDVQEPDDLSSQAKELALDGISLHHTFYGTDDIDRHRFDLEAGDPVTVETLNLVGHTDTRIEVFAPDGVTLVATSDNRSAGDLSSSASFTAAETGTYTLVIQRVALGFGSLVDYGVYDVRGVRGTANVVPMIAWTTSSNLGDTGFGVGAAFADYDADGSPDLYLVKNAGAGDGPGKDVLYRNGSAGVFSPVTQAVGLGVREGGLGAAWGDFDNDGNIDLFVTDHGLFRNEGGTFTDVTESSGVADLGREFDAQWVDTDRDGDLDLFVAIRERPSALWLNQGDGTFLEGAADLGLEFPADGGDAYGCAWGDYDGDMSPDLFVAYRSSRGHGLYRNQGDGTFVEATTAAGLASEDPAAGGVWGDVDGDGALDLFVASQAANKLYINNRDGTFTDRALSYGVNNPGNSYGASLVDYDLDGDLDLFSVQLNGANALYQNLGGSMLRVAEASDFGAGRSAAWADMDDDGDLDLFVARQLEADLMFQNRAAQLTTNQWIKIQLAGVVSNRDGLGAVIRVYGGGKVQVREVGTGVGWTAKSRVPESFGIPGGAAVDSVRVDWPSGAYNLVRTPVTNALLTILEDETTPVLPTGPTRGLLTAGLASPNPFAAASALRFSLTRAAEVDFRVFDVRGRVVRTLSSGLMPEGDHVLGWDGRDDVGRDTAPGAYFFRLQAGDEVEVRKTIRVR